MGQLTDECCYITGITDHDGEGVSADGGLHRHPHPLVLGEHELAHRQQTRLRGLVVQAHPGHLTGRRTEE